MISSYLLLADINFGFVNIHWKPDIRISFIQKENGLISGLFLYAIHTVDKLHDLELGNLFSVVFVVCLAQEFYCFVFEA